MKMAIPSLSKEAAISGLLNHCEKIVGALVLLVAAWLAWGGLNAIRLQSAPANLKPERISSKAGEALAHIDSQREPPAEKLLEPLGVADSIAAWISPAEKNHRKLVLSPPLFDELAKRTQPEVFPVEDLHAVAGVAVLAAPRDAEAAEGRPRGPRFRPPQPGDFQIPGEATGDLLPDQQPDPAENVAPARIVPYVIVTGLIPYAKQTDDYNERFAATSFRDPKRDAPLWADFLIERVDVTNGQSEKWERIDLRAAALANPRDQAGGQADSLPAEFFLSRDEQPGLGDLNYAWPLPQLAMESWGPEALHPWALEELRRRQQSQETGSGSDAVTPTQPVAPVTTPFGGGQSPVAAGNPFGGTNPGTEPTVNPQPEIEKGIDRIPYKLFRFIDTDVKSGRLYRYRVRVSVWNPNYRVPAQHLAQATLAKATKLPSPPSNETAPVSIPGVMRVLARMLPFELKSGFAEVLVLWPHEKTGNFALHSVTTVPGGVIAVQRKIDQEEENDDRGRNRPGRGKQEPTTEPVPVGMLVDFIGQQASPQATSRAVAGRRGKKSAPAEPFELLILGEDGQLRWASPISSEERYRLYANTLPAELRGLPDASKAPNDGSKPIFPGFP